SVAEVERLVVDEEPDELPVRRVHEELARLGRREADLGRGKGPELVEAAEVGPGEAVRLALVEGAAGTYLPGREREERLDLREEVEPELRLVECPRFDAEARVQDHAAARAGGGSAARSVARSRTTTSAPWRRSSCSWSARSTPTTKPKCPLRPASTP